MCNLSAFDSGEELDGGLMLQSPKKHAGFLKSAKIEDTIVSLSTTCTFYSPQLPNC